MTVGNESQQPPPNRGGRLSCGDSHKFRVNKSQRKTPNKAKNKHRSRNEENVRRKRTLTSSALPFRATTSQRRKQNTWPSTNPLPVAHPPTATAPKPINTLADNQPKDAPPHLPVGVLLLKQRAHNLSFPAEGRRRQHSFPGHRLKRQDEKILT